MPPQRFEPQHIGRREVRGLIEIIAPLKMHLIDSPNALKLNFRRQITTLLRVRDDLTRKGELTMPRSKK